MGMNTSSGSIPVTIDHKEPISRICSSLNIPLSEFNFANLYLFRAVHQYRVVTPASDQLAILGLSYDKRSYYMPLYAPTDWNDCRIIAKSMGADSIFPIPEEWFTSLKEQGYAITDNDQDQDYIYQTRSLRDYRGRYYDGHRNSVRRLTSTHTIRSGPLGAESKQAALSVVDAWTKTHSLPEETYEAAVCREAIERCEALDLCGWVYFVDETAAGLIIGCPLTANMYCFHFAKSLPFRGLGAYMFQHATRQLSDCFTFVNWEQDLGIPTLRQFKESYRPCNKAQKGILHL